MFSRDREFSHKQVEASQPTKKLTIIDPWFFNQNRFSFTQEVVKNVLDPFKNEIEVLEIVIPKKLYNKDSYDELAKKLVYLKVNVFCENDFHDKFWIVDERKAFVVGASINGFGNKHFFIQADYLSCHDTKIILDLYKMGTENSNSF